MIPFVCTGRRAGRAWRGILALVLCGVGLALAGGCVSTESDLPWNARQPWEGSPTIPGMNRY